MFAQIALELAKAAHKGQKDKAGNDYILHPIYVAGQMETDAEKSVAYLHDVVEDTDVTFKHLRGMGFSDEIVEAVEAITKRKGELYDEYIKRVSCNPLARKVKLADMKHNSDISRFKHPTEEDYARCKKYQNKINPLTAY